MSITFEEAMKKLDAQLTDRYNKEHNTNFKNLNEVEAYEDELRWKQHWETGRELYEKLYKICYPDEEVK